MNQPITAAIAGLGNRGLEAYGKRILELPEEIKVVAVADIDPAKVSVAREAFGLGEGACFASAEAMLREDRLADALLICTPDREHSKQAIPALQKGYDLLLEKPISPTPEECGLILKTAAEAGRKVVVCHVLRYTPFFQKLKSCLEDGVIGELVTVQAIENVGYYHQAHSFVRGNWRDSRKSSPMILQKCCHDMDIILWLTGKRLQRLSSFGGLYHFRPEHAPAGAAKRCLDGCAVKEGCPYDCEKIYLTDEQTGFLAGHTNWPSNVVALNPTEASLREALRTGPYGRCVYHCDNDVVDHQVVNMELTGGVTVSFTLSGLTSRQHRHMKLMGTTGDIVADMEKNLLTVNRFGKAPEIIDVSKLSDDFSGHSGGDKQLLVEFARFLKGGEAAGASITSIDVSMESHFACFAAEQSRLNGGASVDVAASDRF